ncbi:MAG: hypothetical protein MUP16_10025 [Sedimentisphaerales bacterium]|nr:hypothetical protein [Sedimentisphaerales bacterium]
MKRLILSLFVILITVSICLAPIYKNTASQKVFVFAYDKTTGLGKIDDEPNITAQITTGGSGTVTDDSNPTPVDDTNCPGIYAFDLTQAETNYNQFVLYAKSATSNILIEPVIVVTQASIDQTGDSYPVVNIIAADVNQSNHIWYVAKHGNDSSDGHSSQSAKLTILDTITDACNGDKIIIDIGTCAENVNLLTATKFLWLEGVSNLYSIIEPATGHGLIINSNCTIKNLHIKALGTTSDQGIRLAAYAENVLIENCIVEGDMDGITLSVYDSNNITLRNNTVYGRFDGITFASGTARRIISEGNRYIALGTASGGGQPARGMVGCPKEGIFKNDIFASYRGTFLVPKVNDGAYMTSGGTATFANCIFISEPNVLSTADSVGCYVGSADANLTFVGCSFHNITNASTGKNHDLYVSAGNVTVSGCVYNTLYGTVSIANTGWSAGVSDPCILAYFAITNGKIDDINITGGGGSPGGD